MRYGNRYQADKAAAVNSLFGGENVIDVATPEIPQGVERWSDLDQMCIRDSPYILSLKYDRL